MEDKLEAEIVIIKNTSKIKIGGSLYSITEIPTSEQRECPLQYCQFKLDYRRSAINESIVRLDRFDNGNFLAGGYMYFRCKICGTIFKIKVPELSERVKMLLDRYGNIELP